MNNASKESDTQARIIPVLTYDGKNRLVKTKRFKHPKYIGDPINTVRIFNTKEVDELIILDITASREGRRPNFSFIGDVASEAFMPVAYGGGILNSFDADEVFACGVEKVVLSSAIRHGFNQVEEIARRYGSQAVVVCLSVTRTFLGRSVVRTHSNTHSLSGTPIDVVRRAVESGAGEVLLYSIDRDGMWLGYDLELIKTISSSIDVPVVACGGAKQSSDFAAALLAGASAVAASSMFMFQGPDDGILISYVNPGDLR